MNNDVNKKNGVGVFLIVAIVLLFGMSRDSDGRRGSRQKPERVSVEISPQFETETFSGAGDHVRVERFYLKPVHRSGNAIVVLQTKPGEDPVMPVSADVYGIEPVAQEISSEGPRIDVDTRVKVEQRLEGKMEKVEKKLAEAHGKIQAARDKVETKIVDRARLAFVRSLPSLPELPSLPAIPSPPEFDKKASFQEVVEPARVVVRSDPRATKEKAIADVREKVEAVVSERLVRRGLREREFLEKSVENLKAKIQVNESSTEVAGESYPIYIGETVLQFGPKFDQQVMSLVNHQLAIHRFGLLMTFSFGIAAFLFGYDQCFLGSSRKRGAKSESPDRPIA